MDNINFYKKEVNYMPVPVAIGVIGLIARGIAIAIKKAWF